jgi:hypothetical protein
VASSETNETLRWHDPAWVADAVDWIDEHVERTGEVDHFHSYPWATAMRVPTATGTVWFKACIEELAHEVGTLELLTARRPELVPELIAGDRELGWMLMEDAGERMRELEPQPGQLERWEDAVGLYAELQLEVAADVDAFAAAGVPDRRGAIADGLARVFDDERATRPPNGEPLDDDELARLRGILPKLAEQERRVDALTVPYSIQHDDLHDGNIFVRDGGYRIIDWGDACLTSPLLSLTIAQAVVAYRYGVEPDAPEVTRVRDAYLEPFTRLVPRDELLGALDAVILMGYACGTIKWYEVMAAIDSDKRVMFDVELPARLRRLLELCA